MHGNPSGRFISIMKIIKYFMDLSFLKYAALSLEP